MTLKSYTLPGNSTVAKMERLENAEEILGRILKNPRTVLSVSKQVNKDSWCAVLALALLIRKANLKGAALSVKIFIQKDSTIPEIARTVVRKNSGIELVDSLDELPSNTYQLVLLGVDGQHNYPDTIKDLMLNKKFPIVFDLDYHQGPGTELDTEIIQLNTSCYGSVCGLLALILKKRKKIKSDEYIDELLLLGLFSNTFWQGNQISTFLRKNILILVNMYFKFSFWEAEKLALALDRA